MASGLEKEAKDKMLKSLDGFKQELTHIRTGRASTGLLDSIEVEVYGSRMKLNQIGNITAPEPRMLVISPWDKGQIAVIEKAILLSPLEITPSNDGHVIRLPFPPLTEDRRKDLVKLVGKLAEECKVSVRNIRRHYVDEAKRKQKDGEIPEDEAHKVTAELQKLTDDYCVKVDEAFKSKQDEIMEV
jgi:ribosome recycling factor